MANSIFLGILCVILASSPIYPYMQRFFFFKRRDLEAQREGFPLLILNSSFNSIKNSLLLLALFFASTLNAQDPVFSQFYAAPLQLNPAFAGNTYAPFVTINYRNQWSGFVDLNTYITYAASYSQYIEGLNSGIGLMLEADDSGNGIFRTTRVGGFYSYKLMINKDLNLKFGLEAAYVQNRLDWSKLLFGDQIDVTGEIDLISGEAQPENLSANYLDLSTGILVYNSLFYGGLTVKHLNRPDESILGINDNIINSGLPIRFSVHGGAQIDLGGNKRGRATFLSPNILYVKQGDFNQINAGAYLSFGSFFAGGWYRHTSSNSDAAIGLFGFQKDSFKFGYSFDFTISGLAGLTGGTHEFSMVINLDANRPRRIDYNDCFQMFR